ncbi:MAG: aminotransferase class V-fold PLP-dependent enzyme, partial [Candidatus Methylomirabilales bacterium]
MTTPGSTTTPKVREGRLASFEVEKVRKDFPILSEKVHGKSLVYFDNAATSQKPQVVIDTVHRYLATYNANIHRGVHGLSERATEAFEDSRKKLQRFINAAQAREVVFVRGTTEAINLVAQSYGRTHI